MGDEDKVPENGADVKDTVEPTGQKGDSATDQTDEANKSTSTPEGKKGEADKKFTQEDVDKLIGKVRGEAKDASIKAMLKEFGVDNVDALKTVVAEAEEIKKASLTEEQKTQLALSEAEKRLTTLEREKAEAEADAKKALIRSAVVAQAATRFEDAEVAFRLIDVATLSVNDTGGVDGVEEALDGLVKKYPWMLKKGASKTSVANPVKSAEERKKSDDTRRQEYFGRSKSDFWEGQGVKKIIEIE